MNEELFRKESMEQIKSPERTEEYLKVSNPSVWLVIIAAVILLGSFFVWGYFAKIPTRLPAVGIVKNGEISMFLSAEDILSVQGDMEVLIDGISHPIHEISDEILSAEDLKTQYDDVSYYQLKLADWNFEVTADAQGVADGVKSVSIVMDNVRPMEYLMQGQTVPQAEVKEETK